MTGWKKRSSAISNPTTHSSNATRIPFEEEDEIDYNEDIPTSPNIHLLFSKTSPISPTAPLFPTSRQNFLIMTCKRTLLACRGFLLFCLVVILILAFVGGTSEFVNSSVSDTTSTSDKNVLANNLADSNASSVGFRVAPLPLPNYVASAKAIQSTLANKQINVKLNVNCGYRNTDYALTANSLSKGLDFYAKNIENITVLDAALGAKIVGEQLKHLLLSHANLPEELSLYMNTTSEKSFVVSSKIVEIVKKVTNDSEGLKHTLPWIETPDLWDLPINRRWHPLGSLKAYEPPTDEGFEDIWQIVSRKEMIKENESDACIYQVFHCDTANITINCQAKFLDKAGSMYSLTHQVIYMLLAQKKKCPDKGIWSNVPSLQDGGKAFLEKLCGKVWQEANSIAESKFPPRFRDLFVEQIGMCSLAGYIEFLKPEWLRRIVSWQSTSSSGCFGERRRRNPNPTIGMLIQHYQRKQSQQLAEFRHTLNKAKSSRLKRSDVLLEDGNSKDKCSVHFTSVGIAALSMHLRYMFDSCFDTY